MQIMESSSKVLNEQYFKLKKDVPTRWNSTYEMILSLIKMKKVINYLIYSEKSFKNFNFSTDIWDKLKLIEEFLSPFYECTKIISGKTYCSICYVLPIIANLMQHFNDEKFKDTIISDSIISGKSKLIQYKNYLINDLSIFALILDPRIKFDFDFKLLDLNNETVRYEFEKIYNNNYKFSTNCSETEKRPSFLSNLYKRHKSGDDCEITKYLNTPNTSEDTDPINWWHLNRNSFPQLSKFAFDILSIPASSVPSEQEFSKSGDLISKKRNRLKKDSIRYSMCLNSWINYFNM